jgi:hypothetical protein
MEIVQRYEALGTFAPSSPRADTIATAAARLAKIMDPFGLTTAVRTDAAGDAKNAADDAREKMISRAKEAWRTPRADRDASREGGVRLPTTPAPSGTKRNPSSEYAAPNTFGGNTGDPAGDLGGGKGMWDDSETRAAQAAMMERQRNAWKKPRADRKGRGHGVNGGWNPNGAVR